MLGLVVRRLAGKRKDPCEPACPSGNAWPIGKARPSGNAWPSSTALGW